MLLAASVVAMAGVGALARGVQEGGKRSVALLAEGVSGALFAAGLTYTGMVRPTKVSLELAFHVCVARA